MTPKELTEIAVKELNRRKAKSKNEICAYLREQNVKNKKRWSVRAGGYRW